MKAATAVKKHALLTAIVCLLIFFACLTIHIVENPQKSIVGTYAANDNMTGEVAAFGLDNTFILYNRTVGTISEGTYSVSNEDEYSVARIECSGGKTLIAAFDNKDSFTIVDPDEPEMKLVLPCRISNTISASS
ncbi:MAG: hypothetical protein ACOYJO_02965 [Eubacterium sp.]